jgi:hypothetical protein
VLSLFLLSAQSRKFCMPRYKAEAFMIQQPGYSSDDEDLSGCLASQYTKRQKPSEPKTSPANNRDDDGDLSGCLAAVLRKSTTIPLQPKKSVPPRKQPEASGDLDSGDLASGGLGSDWLYTN